MQKLTFTNSRGESIILGNSAPYILSKIEGTGGVETEIQTTKAPYQDGSTAHDVILGERSIPVEGAVFAKTAEEMYALRKSLSRVLNPKYREGVLKYENDAGIHEIKAIAEESPKFSEKYDHSKKQLFIINFIAPNPFWLDTYEESEEMADWIGGLSFPLQLPVQFAGRSTQLNKAIRNVGDVDAPITFEFSGPATNPKVYNANTGEYIQVNKDILADELLVVTTEFGNKKVILKFQSTLPCRERPSCLWDCTGQAFL